LPLFPRDLEIGIETIFVQQPFPIQGEVLLNFFCMSRLPFSLRTPFSRALSAVLRVYLFLYFPCICTLQPFPIQGEVLRNFFGKIY
jgi:hypothetical protein